MNKVLITGVCGFCGRHLVNRLKKMKDIHICGIDISQKAQDGVLLDKYEKIDITDKSQVSRLLHLYDPDHVFHLAGIKYGSVPDLYRVNVLGCVNLLESIRQFAPNARVLVVGSAAEYGYVDNKRMPIRESYPCNPIGTYGLSKYAATLATINYVRNYRINALVARPFNIVGGGLPPSLVIGAILKQAREVLAYATNRPRTIEIGNLDAERDFIAIEDVVDAYVKMIEGDYWGEVFNICSGKPQRVGTIVEQLLANANGPVRLKVDPKLVRPSEIQCIFGSYEKAKETFSFTPKVSIQAALAKAWEYAMGERYI